ncbi:arabinosylfuranosidase ArfA [Konateibacter massiliensis]|uniref:arabinosylfuranosidase ArfA n=1 Tax=Konateibacter massiliensis TaxID=2002841 RepID=UPI000C150C44|nr:alpha-N-arabinofuranosidase [Konateibacter massiliensis]
MKKLEIIINKNYKIGEIDKRIYGSFVEHMGRVVYTGIYEPNHPCSDEEGFRTDVIEAVKNLGITTVRYPGGNFVSAYNWEDGVGPKEQRPKRLELAWKAIETNEFGTNEFMKWIKKVEAEPMLAVNLGIGGIKEAVQYLEYCNFPQGTKYSDMRRQHGVVSPYKVKTWCLGNEMDGPWQIGHKTPEEYGRIAQETAKSMKVIDSNIELVSCGSSLNTMETFPEWEAKTLDYTYEHVDYISLHQYFAGQDLGTERFLAQADDMDRYIKTVIATCDYIKAKKRSVKTLNISFDEWGVWAYDSSETVKQCNEVEWQVAPPISEMVYTFEDSLLFAGMLLVLLKNADRVKMACQSLLTNVSATIMTKQGGELWLQPTYFPFSQVAKYGHGVVLDIRADKANQMIDCVAVYREELKEIVLFVINRSLNENIEIEVNLQGFKAERVLEHSLMKCEDPKMTNALHHEAIKPYNVEHTSIRNGNITSNIVKLSWNMIRIGL